MLYWFYFLVFCIMLFFVFLDYFTRKEQKKIEKMELERKLASDLWLDDLERDHPEFYERVIKNKLH